MHFWINEKKSNFLGHNPLSIFHNTSMKKLQQIQSIIFLSNSKIKVLRRLLKMIGRIILGLKLSPI